MAPEGGRESVALIEQLFQQAYRYDFFQAVRLLERTVGKADQSPAICRQPVGRDVSPRSEAVRFGVQPTLGFPAASISQLRPPQAQGTSPQPDTPPVLTVTFMGLTGPNGVLPVHYTRLIMRRARERDHAFREFLDLFHHRLISLFYRAWEKYRLPFTYERGQLGDDAIDWATQALFSLVGLGTNHLRGRLEVDDEAFLYYAGHFARGQRSAMALESMLADYFELHVAIRQYEGRWLYLEAEDRSLLAGRGYSLGQNCDLGVNLVVGEKVWNVESKFRVRIGPLHYSEFRRFMPNGDALRPLSQMVRAFVGP